MTWLFSVADDIDESATKLNNDLMKVNDWVYKLMPFNLDIAKQAHRVAFSRKSRNIIKLYLK